MLAETFKSEWGLSQDYVNHSQVGNVFMLGVGGLFVVALSSYFGRLPVLFWFTFTAVWTAAGCAGSETFNAVRISINIDFVFAGS